MQRVDVQVGLCWWVAFAQKTFGITNRLWNNWSKGIDNIKNPEVRAAVEAINTRICGVLSPEALKGAVNAGLASRQIECTGEREGIADRSDAAKHGGPPKLEREDPRLAIYAHPGDPDPTRPGSPSYTREHLERG